MAPPSQPQIPPVAMQFLLFLGKAESAVAGNGSFWESEESEECREDEIFRSKLHAYEAVLRTQLANWKGLSDPAKERYRSRIEDLLPTLERTLERRCKPAEDVVMPAVSEEPVPLEACDRSEDG